MRTRGVTVVLETCSAVARLRAELEAATKRLGEKCVGCEVGPARAACDHAQGKAARSRDHRAVALQKLGDITVRLGVMREQLTSAMAHAATVVEQNAQLSAEVTRWAPPRPRARGCCADVTQALRGWGSARLQLEDAERNRSRLVDMLGKVSAIASDVVVMADDHTATAHATPAPESAPAPALGAHALAISVVAISAAVGSGDVATDESGSEGGGGDGGYAAEAPGAAASTESDVVYTFVRADGGCHWAVPVGETAVGRVACLAIEDSRVSRTHARVSLDAAGVLRITLVRARTRVRVRSAHARRPVCHGSTAFWLMRMRECIVCVTGAPRS